ASLAWLPQETILFEGARLRRSIKADLAPKSRLLVLESLVFGREAMGEDLSDLVFHDRWRLSRAGRLVYGDDLCVEGPVREILGASAGFAGMRAAASLVYLAPQAEDFAPRLKRKLTDPSVRLAASGWDGVLSMRCLAPSARLLRAALVDLLSCFEDHPLPRVWQS
ncbi:MAG: urease accessory protein UreD, partial [Pseudomonadota bacterium]